MARSRDDLSARPEPTPATVPSRYRVHLLSDAKSTDRGIVYRRGDKRLLLAWDRILRAFAAEVGEPEGVRTIVFDLVVEKEGGECVAVRFDADPVDGAQRAARAIEVGVGGELCDHSLRALAAEACPTRSFADLETLEEWVLEAVRFKVDA